jgi:GH15 family glucan-1,4-alpha-glucosidase
MYHVAIHKYGTKYSINVGKHGLIAWQHDFNGHEWEPVWSYRGRRQAEAHAKVIPYHTTVYCDTLGKEGLVFDNGREPMPRHIYAI